MMPTRITRIASVLLLILVAPNLGSAGACEDLTRHAATVGSCTITANDEGLWLRDIAVSPFHAYVSTWQMLHVIDLSAPISPSEVASLPLTGTAPNLTQLRLEGDHLYGIDPNTYNGGLTILDVSEPTQPVRRGSIYLENESVRSFVLRGSHALVLANDGSAAAGRVVVVDVGDVDAPQVSASRELGMRGQILGLGGDVLLVGTSWGDLLSFDVSDPTNLVPGNTLDLGSRIQSIAFHGGYAYVTTGDAVLYVLDASDAQSVTPLSSRPGFDFHEESLVAHGDRLYGLGVGVWAVDISLAAEPVVLGHARVPRPAYELSADANASHLCIATSEGDVFVMDWSDPVSVIADTPLSNLGPTQDFYASGYVGFALLDSSLVSLSFADPASPELLGSLPLPALGSRLLVEAGIAHVVTRSGSPFGNVPLTLTLVDVADPEIVTPLGSVEITPQGSVVDIARWGSFLYVTTFETADGLAYLRIFDVGDPGTPTLEATTYLNFFVGFEGSVWQGPRMDIEDGVLALGFYNGFELLDLSTPVAPALISHSLFSWHRSSDVQLDGDLVYVSFHIEDEWYSPPAPDEVERTAGLHIVDVSNPTAPITLGVHETSSSPRHLVVEGSHAYVAVDGGGWECIDVRDPSQPAFDGYWMTFEPGPLSVVRDRLFAAFERAPYLQSVPLPCGAEVITPAPERAIAARRLDVYPSPFNPRTEIRFELENSEFARVQVYDVRGRRVRLLHEGRLAAGLHRLVWDGRDGRGRAAASGSYRILLETETDTRRGGAVLVR